MITDTKQKSRSFHHKRVYAGAFWARRRTDAVNGDVRHPSSSAARSALARVLLVCLIPQPNTTLASCVCHYIV